MRIKVLSDLHLEGADFDPINNGADVLILSGDICVIDKIDRFIPFFEKVSQRFPLTFYVPGNHEYYKGAIDTSLDKLCLALCEFDNIALLENGGWMFGKVHFQGGTLWTDLNGNDPITEDVLRHGMNDYRLIRVAKDDYRALTPQDTRKIHLATLNELDREFYKGIPTVMVTHHAPSFKSVDPDFADDYFTNGGYASNLEQFILAHPEIRLWTHGHMHASSDYMIGNCRVVANPRGYMRSGNGGLPENRNFDPNHLIELDIP